MAILFWPQNIVLTEHCSSMVHKLQDLAGLKFVWMAYGGQFVTISGTTEMLVLYADNLDSQHMVQLLSLF